MAVSVLSFEEVWALSSAVDGWLERDEAELLHRYCEPPWCEVGTYLGRSAVILADKGPGVCIDDFSLDGASYERTRGVLPDYVEVIDGKLEHSHQFVADNLRFLHLDADHSFESTALAFGLYAPKLVKGGHLAIHDVYYDGFAARNPWPEVTAFAEALMKAKGWRYVDMAGRTAMFERCGS